MIRCSAPVVIVRSSLSVAGLDAPLGRTRHLAIGDDRQVAAGAVISDLMPMAPPVILPLRVDRYRPGIAEAMAARVDIEAVRALMTVGGVVFGEAQMAPSPVIRMPLPSGVMTLKPGSTVTSALSALMFCVVALAPLQMKVGAAGQAA